MESASKIFAMPRGRIASMDFARAEAGRREAVFLWALLALTLAAHAWFATHRWTVGFMAGHEFRQAQTALIADYIDRENDFSLLYETPVLGKPWVGLLLEVPFYQWAVVGLSRLTDWSHVVSARTISLASFYLGLPAIYLLLARFGLSPARRAYLLAVIAACPVLIFYSRAFLIDPLEHLCCVWFLYGFVRMMEERRWTWFLLASAAGAGAALIKSAMLAVWLLPAAGCVAWQLAGAVRERRFGAAAEIIFWSVAGVAIPLGALQFWIALTDPIKAAHASAWIFTSKNLSQGNWGLTNLAARFSPELWGVLAQRWREALLPAWAIGWLLLPGLVFLPRVRGPVLLMAGMFLLAQILFPFAYAYQDYYFYSCAAFLAVALGFVFLGLLDTRLPAWLGRPLLLVPIVALLANYRQGYQPLQNVQSNGGSAFTAALRDHLPPGAAIVVAGSDWSPVIPLYARRRALMIRNGLENDGAYLDRAFAELGDEEVAALVLTWHTRGNRNVLDRAIPAFDFDAVPTFQHETADIYISRRYRDRMLQGLRGTGNYGGYLRPAEGLAPVPAVAEPFRLTPVFAQGTMPMVSPSPVRARFETGLTHLWVGDRKVLFAHPGADLWLPPSRHSRRIEWDFGMVPASYEKEGGRTDGVELRIEGLLPGGDRREIYRRFLDPVRNPADRGLQQAVIPYQPEPGEILHFSGRPGPWTAFDWLYWARIEVR